MLTGVKTVAIIVLVAVGSASVTVGRGVSVGTGVTVGAGVGVRVSHFFG